MERERDIDRLARYIINIAGLALIVAVCCIFRQVIGYILMAGVLSLIGQPISNQLEKVRIKGHEMPDWLRSILTILIMGIVLLLIFTRIIPIVTDFYKELSLIDLNAVTAGIRYPMSSLNQWLIQLFQLDSGFNIETVLLERLQGVFDLSKVPAIVSSVASGLLNLIIAVFSITFMSFFFIKDPGRLRNLICAFVPEKHEQEMQDSLTEISSLLSRYFVGLVLEMTGVGLINFLGMWLIAGLGARGALAIAFLTGLLNIIPYVGPCIGYVIGIGIGVMLKYSFGLGIGAELPIFILILLAIMLFTQIIDVFVYQPVIYSNSIKASALEVFIVLLMAGYLLGVGGMVAAIPGYTVIRVIAAKFGQGIKFIRKLTEEK